MKNKELVEALEKLEHKGLVTADIDLYILYEGDERILGIRVEVIQVDGQGVTDNEVLTAQLTLPQRPGQLGRPKVHVKEPTCAKHDWSCRFFSWLKSLTGGCSAGKHGEEPNNQHGEYHHRFHGHRNVIMRFIVYIVIPVLIGSAVGVGISILSVFVVEILRGIVMKIRGRRPGYENIEYVVEEFDEELPVYEALENAPEYTDEKQ